MRRDTRIIKRYEAFGNSMAITVMRRVGEQIDMVDDILGGKA